MTKKVASGGEPKIDSKPGDDGRRSTNLEGVRAPGFEDAPDDGDAGDPEETDSDESGDSTEEEEVDSGDGSSQNVSDVDLLALQQKAAAFDLISSDPIAASAVEEWRDRLLGRAPAKKTTNKKTENQEADISPEMQNRIDSLEKQIALQNRRAAEAEYVRVKESYPDFGKYERQIAQLVRNHGLSLDDAYVLAKSRSNHGNKPVAPEGRPGAVARQSQSTGSDAVLAKARKKIESLAGTGRSRLNAATEIAFEAAIQAQNEKRR